MSRSGSRPQRASEDVVAQILDTFYTERMKPGEWLGTEAELAERFNVSRVTIRDAVSALSARGLVEVRVGARGGLRIATSDPDRLIDAFSIQLRLMGLTRDELFEAMLAIEPVTAALAAERASDVQIANLQALVEQSRTVLDEPEPFTNLAVGFHQALADMSANRALRASLAALRSTQLAHLGPPTTRPVAERVARIHFGIFEAIAARDAVLARERMLEHLAGLSSGDASHTAARLVASV
ncbi:MAG TPA: FCD domain-containing protein [Chloroflexota bacterium]|jgi:DNA-binding FadR family transcriptional regulator|nr:FCD domain-containing protein [Chloroflexota bacterium]